MALLPDAAKAVHLLTGFFLIQECCGSSVAIVTEATVLPPAAVNTPVAAAGKLHPIHELPESLMRRQRVLDRFVSSGRHAQLAVEDHLAHSIGHAQLDEGADPTSPTDQESVAASDVDPGAKNHTEVFEYKDEFCENMSGGFRLPDKADLNSGACVPCTDISSKEKATEAAMGLPANVMVTCPDNEDDPVTLSRIFGQDCSGGQETPHDFDIEQEEAKKFNDGSCIKAERRNTKMHYYLQIKNADKLGKIAPCLTQPVSDDAKRNMVLFIAWIIAVAWGSMCLVGLIGASIMILMKRRKNKKGEKPEGEEEAKEEPAEAADAADAADADKEKEEGETDDAAEAAKKEEDEKKAKAKSGGFFGSMGF